MSQRIRTIERPAFVGVPPATIPAAEWTATQGQASRAATQRYDVRAYGAIGTANDGPAFAAAVAGITSGIITAPAGHYTFTSGFALKDGVYLEFPGSGNTTLDFSGMTTPVTVAGAGAAIGAAGSYTALPSLSATASADARTLTFASAPSVAPGDVILLYNPADYSFSPYRNYYRNGEYARVLSVSSTTVTLTAPLYATHPTTVQVHKLNPVRAGIRGARIIGKTGSRLLRFSKGTRLRFDDLDLSGSDYSLLELDKCYDVTLSRVRGVDFSSPSVAINYGVSVSNSQSVYVSDSHLETSRHGFTTTGDAEVGCIPNRDIKVTDSYVGSTSAVAQYGLDLHGNTEDAVFANVTAPFGVQLAGDRVTLRDCPLIGSGLNGVCVFTRELLGADIRILGNVIRPAAHHVASWAFISIRWFGATGLTRTGGTVKVNDNTLALRGYRAASGTTAAIHITPRADSDLPVNNAVEVKRNTVTYTGAATGSAAYAIWVQGDTGRGFRRVIVTGNDLTGMGIDITALSPQLLDLSDNTVIDAIWRGIGVTWYTTAPNYSNSILRCDRATVLHAYGGGINLDGVADTTVLSDGCVSLDNGWGGLAGLNNSSSMYVTDAGRVIRRNATVGDRQATPTQSHVDGFNTVAVVEDTDPITLGSVTTLYRNAVGSEWVRFKGTGAPTRAVANGSVYLRTDGAAVTTLYVREGGAWVAK